MSSLAPVREVPVGRADRVRHHLEVHRRPQLEIADFAGRRQAGDVVDTGDRRPVHLLALAADVTREVHAPGLRRRSVAKRAERNPELGRPPLVGDQRLHGPRAVPVDVQTAAGAARRPSERRRAARLCFTLVPDLCVVFHAERVGAEDEAVLMIEVRVEDDLERVHVVQARVAARVSRDDLRRLRVVTHDADVQRVIVEQQTHLRPLGGGSALDRLRLNEIADRRRRVPRPVVQHAIDRRRLADSGAAHALDRGGLRRPSGLPASRGHAGLSLCRRRGSARAERQRHHRRDPNPDTTHQSDPSLRDDMTHERRPPRAEADLSPRDIARNGNG